MLLLFVYLQMLKFLVEEIRKVPREILNVAFSNWQILLAGVCDGNPFKIFNGKPVTLSKMAEPNNKAMRVRHQPFPPDNFISPVNS